MSEGSVHWKDTFFMVVDYHYFYAKESIMKQVIISLTTYPARIMGITKVLDSMKQQTRKADKIVLYLSERQFEGKKIPVDLSAYFEYGLEIHWCPDDMKSHKKYLYALKEYADDYVITIDDDFYYHERMIAEFLESVEKYPHCVLARRVHLITADQEGHIARYEDWWGECVRFIGVPRMDLFAVGCGGILYPPHIFNEEIFHVENIKRYCMFADDVWLKVMETINSVPVVHIDTEYRDICDTEYAQDGLYQNHNEKGGNDRQLRETMLQYDHFQGMRESLTERIFSGGCVYACEVEKGMREDLTHLVDGWVRKTDAYEQIVIYGAGYMANRVYLLLKQYQKEHKVRAFVVKETAENPKSLNGIDVIQYQRADYRDTACVTALLKEKTQFEIVKQLRSLGLAEEQIYTLNDKLRYVLNRMKLR